MFSKDNLPPNLAPHRFRWDADIAEFATYREARENATYRAGEIVAVDRGGALAFAQIDNVLVGRDRYGEFRAYWRVRFFNKKGELPKPYKRQPYVWAGHIQRGYLRAGLAPDCEGKIDIS